MTNLTNELFLNVSQIVGVRVTPENLRLSINGVSATGGVTNKVKTDILVELLLAFAKLEEKIDERREDEKTV